MVTGIILAAAVVGILGILIGIFLGVASEKFKVEVDEREILVRNELPGNNCGGCGYASQICSGSYKIFSASCWPAVFSFSISNTPFLTSSGIQCTILFIVFLYLAHVIAHLAVRERMQCAPVAGIFTLLQKFIDLGNPAVVSCSRR